MARPRKTVDVSVLLAEANRLMALPDNEHVNADFRKGVDAMINTVLHATGNYKGFEWIGWADSGYTQWVNDGRPQPVDAAKYIGDETRKRYFGAPVTDDTSDKCFYPASLTA